MRGLTSKIFVLLLSITSGISSYAGKNPHKPFTSPLCGYYSIGASQPAGFQNLTQAMLQLGTNGVACAVTFELQADYTSASETFPIVINAFAGADEFNTLTIKPAYGVSAVISGSSINSIIKINGA